MTPLTAEARSALERARRAKTAERSAIGDGWVFPSGSDPNQPGARSTFLKWWTKAEREAELAQCAGRGWHALRRKFATELKETPLRDLCYLGGWKEPTTVLICYQAPDVHTMQMALEARRPTRVASK